MKAVLVLKSSEEFDDLVEWMNREGANDEFDPTLWGYASDWLTSLEPDVFPFVTPIPNGYSEPIKYVIDDWCELLSQYEDTDPFLSEVVYNFKG